MIRKLALVTLTLLTVLASAEVKPFTFIQFSDVHIGAGDNELRLKQALADSQAHFPEAEFIICTGDLTEFGFEDQFSTVSALFKTSKIPVYPTTGNHDVRWSNSGKENYRHTFGDTYKTFDHNGVRFVMMDSSMLIEHYGHFDGMQLAQLKKDLDSMPQDGFAVLAMHHPPLHPGHFIDNEFQFADLIGQYNVPLVCDGHGHAFMRYERNGTTYCMGGSVSDGGAPKHSYRVYKVEPGKITAITRIYDRNITETQDEIPTDSRKRPDLQTTVSQNLEMTATVNGKPWDGNAMAMLDQNATASLNFSAGKASIADLPYSNGIHQITTQVVADETTVISTVLFETDKERGTTISRRFPLKSGNQSHPVVKDDNLYVGANDGYMRAYDLADPSGKLLWETNLNSEILSSPAVTTTSLYVGSMDSNVYCLDRETGNVRWKFKTGQAVLASPLVADDVVFIGSGDHNMYALDANTGKKLWSFAAEKLIKATPALANGRLFFGAWDNFFYGLDAKTGELIWKTPVSIRSNGHFSAATSNPVIAGENIIFCSHDYSVRCLSQESGGTLWVYQPDKTELGPSYSTAVVKGDIAYFGSINGHVVGHNVDTGKKVFDVDVRPEKKDDLFDSVPALKDGKLYVGSVNGNVYCVDIKSSKVAWKVALQPGFIFTGPALWKDRVLVGSLNDMVYEISPTSAP